MTIRRRFALLFLAATLISFCCYVFFYEYKDNFPSAYHPDADRTTLNLSPDTSSSSPSAITELYAGHPFVKHDPDAPTPASERPLITYVYYETDFARPNLQFFLNHALHDAADFIFILNGETDVEKLIFNDPYADVPTDIRHLFPYPSLSNVFVKKRPNTCFDLGAHAEILQSAVGDGTGWMGINGAIHGPMHRDADGQGQLLRHRYNRFIMLNGSIRGPFLPTWSRSCWSDVYLNRLTARIKLVGMSYNCHFGNGHVQSMIWATDRTGLDLMLTREGMGECFAKIGDAMAAEVRMTKLLRDNDYEVDAFLSNYHSMDKEAKWARMRARMQTGPGGEKPAKREIAAGESSSLGEDTSVAGRSLITTEEEREEMWSKMRHEIMSGNGKRDDPAPPAPSPIEPDTETHHAHADISAQHQNYTSKLEKDTLDEPGYFWRECKDEDWLGRGSYAGSFVHPYENLFMKSHRGIADQVLGNLTQWMDGSGRGAWETCM